MKVIFSKSHKKKKLSFVLIHGWEGSPNKEWFLWLNKKLIKDGHDVLSMTMPNPKFPDKNVWLKHLEDFVLPTKDTVLIGHSMGGICVLKYLEKISQKIKASILVAPYLINDKNWKTVSSFYSRKINWEKVNKNCNKFFTIYSDNDPYVSLDKHQFIREKIDADLIVLHNKGHFSEEDNITKIPELYDIIKSL
tara:strand:- start:15340 stop:15918 length:579 start_codon:yes stop_codon:yes gene_type:complete